MADKLRQLYCAFCRKATTHKKLGKGWMCTECGVMNK